jgi:hypothetical protein
MEARGLEDGQGDKPLIMILVKRSAIFLFVLCAISLFYWIVGSVSSFLDETQTMLLGIIRVSSLGIVVAAGIGILLSLAFALARRYRLRLMSVLGYAFAALLGAAALAIAQSVSILNLGLR